MKKLALLLLLLAAPAWAQMGAQGYTPPPGNAAMNTWTPSFVARGDSAGAPAAGGANYAVGDDITLSNGVHVSVETISGSAIATFNVTQRGAASSIPSNPVAQVSTSGSGTGATFNLTWVPASTVDAFQTTGGLMVLGYGAGVGMQSTGLGPTGYGFKCCGSGANSSDGMGGGTGMNGGETSLYGFFTGTQLTKNSSWITAFGLNSASHEVDGSFSTYYGGDNGKYALNNLDVVSAGANGAKYLWNSRDVLAQGYNAFAGQVINPAVSGVVINGGTLLARLTVASTTGMTTNDAVFIGGVVGSTEVNTTNGATATHATPKYINVIDGTHIDLQGVTAITPYVSGGAVLDLPSGFTNYHVLGAASNGGLIQLTVDSTFNVHTGDTVHVAGVVGTTEANGDWTVTVNNNICQFNNSCKVTLQGSTFTNAYVSGGRMTDLHGPYQSTAVGSQALSSSALMGGFEGVTVLGQSGGIAAKNGALATLLGANVGATTWGTAVSAGNPNGNIDIILAGVDTSTDVLAATTVHSIAIGQNITVPSNSVLTGFRTGFHTATGATNWANYGYQAGAAATTAQAIVNIGPLVGSTTHQTGNNVVLVGTDQNCDTPANNTGNYIAFCAGSTPVLAISATNTPTASLATFSGQMQIGGTKFTTSGCSVSATTGNGTAGTYTSGTSGSCAVVITMNGATGITAANGWACFATDRTTPADIQTQTATTTTTATITGTTVSGDVVQFACRPY